MQMIDSTTLQDLQAGNPKAHSDLYERYRQKVYTFCYRMTLNAEVAADITQDVFLKVLSQIGTLERAEAFSSWLFAIARNEIYAFFRKSRDQRPLNEEEVWETETPVDQVIAHEEAALLNRLVEALQPHYREVIVLREFEGLSYAQIAQVAGCTEAAVKARLFKARKALIKKLTPLVGEE